MSEKLVIKAPILLIGFNRPDIIQQSLNNLGNYAIQKLYVAIDGPRPGNEEDVKNVSQVRQIVKSIDFCPNVKYKISDNNNGAEVTVSSAITWVLEKEEYVIVMEDDIIAHESFFRFMDDMLERYKNDERVAMVSGCNYTPMPFPNSEDYCFCQSGHTWGWATWARVWKNYDLFENVKEEYLTDSFLCSISANKKIAKNRKHRFLKIKENGEKNNWDVMFSYYLTTRGYLCIVPRAHLTSNIGAFGLHYKGTTEALFRSIDDSFVAVRHPKEVVWNKKYDAYHYHHWIENNIMKRIIGRLKRLFH